ncbi:MAG: NUDIX domain-containing protein [Flavobacteriales bacterium]|nr:NUDIX domain-containing protein [Flavobacteriales bacterium]
MVPWKLAVLIIVEYQGKYLFLQRKKEPNKGKYVPIGGKIENLELPSETAIRETKEESNLSISEPKLIGHLFETSPIEYQWMSFLYHAVVEDISTLKASEEGDLFWFDLTQLRDVPCPATLLPILNAYRKGDAVRLHVKYDHSLKIVDIQNNL